MAKPTQEEIEKQIKRLEAEMLGGYVPPSVYKDLLGIPKLGEEALYLKTPFPTGMSLGTSGGTPLKQTTLDELTDLKLTLEEEKLKKVGMSMSAEQKKARRDELYQQGYEDYIKPPLSTAFGGMEEKGKAQPKVLGVKVPEAPTMSEAGDVGLLTPFQVQSKSIDTEIDWLGFKQSMINDGKTPDEAQEAVNVSRKSLDAYMKLNPDLDPMTAYKNLMDEMEAIGNAPKIKKPEIEGFEKTTSAFGRQVTEADMPQDLTPEQMELAKEMIKINQDKVYQQAKAIDPSKPIPHIRVTIDDFGTFVDIPKTIYQAIMASNPKLPNYQPFINQKTDDLVRNGVFTDETMRPLNQGVKNVAGAVDNYARAEAIMKAGDPNAWYLNPEAKKAVLSNPEKYIQEGWFSSTSPFGDVAETGGAYGFRMLMSPLNAIAGTLQYVAEVPVGAVMGAVAEGGEAVGLLPEADYFDPMELSRQRRKTREKETPLYADSPILANIALNKGFTGEAQDIANAMNLEGWEKGAVIGGGFLLDIASPDVAIVAATAKGLKGIPQFTAAQKAMYGTSEGAIKQALKGAGSTFMNDLNGVSAILSKTKVGKTLKEVPHGSVVAHIGDTNASLLAAQRRIGKAMDLAEVEDIMKSLPENHPYTRELESFVVRGEEGKIIDADISAMNQVDALAYARQADPTNAKLLDEWADTHKALDEVVDAGKTLDEADPLAKANRELINNVSVSKFGKSFDDITGLQKTLAIEDTKAVIDANYAKAITLNTLGPKELAELDKVFAVTAKTWAHETAVPKLIATANDTELGRVLADIRSSAKVISAAPMAGGARIPFTETRIGPARAQAELLQEGTTQRVFNLTDEQASKLAEQVRNNPTISAALKEGIETSLRTNQVTFRDFRALVDANIDNTAKGLSGTLGAEDVSKLSGEAQERLLAGKGEKGLLTRGLALTRKGVEKLYRAVGKETLLEAKSTAVPMPSIQLRRAQAEIMNEASQMDKKLRSVFDGLLDGDPATRQLYGVPDDVVLTPEEALSYAILGPVVGVKPADIAKGITDIADWAVSRAFFTQDYRVSFLDSFTGRRQIINNDLLNERGREAWRQWTEAFGKTFASGDVNRGRLLEAMREDMFLAYKEILNDPKNLRVGVSPEKIVDASKRATDTFQENFAISMFYNAEGSRIVNKKLAQLQESSVLSTNTKNILGDDYERAQRILGGNADARFKEAVAYHATYGQNRHVNNEEVIAFLVERDPQLGEKFRNAGYKFDKFYEGLSNTEKARLSVYATISRKAQDTGDIINKNLKLNDTKLPAEVNNLNDIIDYVAKDENLGKLVLGEGIYDDLIKKAEGEKLQSLTNELDAMLRGSTLGDKAWRAVRNFAMGVNNFFYNALLSWNPRFHGGNTVTAPTIMYQTTGSTAGFNPRLVNKGQRIAFQAQSPDKRFYYEIAVIDRTGRPWTYGELNEILQSSGVTSQYDFVTKGLGRDGLADYIKQRNRPTFGLSGGAKDWADKTILTMKQGSQNLVMKEDQVFRATAMLEALEQGKSIEDATTIARKSLFDYNDMADWEKATAARFFVFYSFQRQNFANFIEAMGDARKMKRYLNTYKFKRGAETAAIAANDDKRFDDRFFFDDKFSNRIILDIMNREEDMVAFGSPPIPALDAPLQAFRLFYNPVGEVGEVTAGLLNPAIKKLVKVPSKFDREFYRIPPEVLNPAVLPHSLFYDLNDPLQVASFWEGWLGGSITPREGTPAEGALNGYVYPLDENQRAKLKTFLETIGNTTGFVSMNSNYYKLFSGEGTTYEGVPFPARVVTTPMGLTEKDRIELYNLQARQAEIEKELAAKKSELRRQRNQ